MQSLNASHQVSREHQGAVWIARDEVLDAVGMLDVSVADSVLPRYGVVLRASLSVHVWWTSVLIDLRRHWCSILGRHQRLLLLWSKGELALLLLLGRGQRHVVRRKLISVLWIWRHACVEARWKRH